MKNRACDVCIYDYRLKIDGPKTLLSINGKRYTGHRNCMKRIHDEQMKQVSISRHTVRW